jgi:predicted DNA-binding protein
VEVVSIRVSKELKEEMRRLDLDWSQYIRDVIEHRVRLEKSKQACYRMDEIRKKTAKIKFDSVKVIRAARDNR